MCFSLGGSQMLIPPTPKAAVVVQYLKLVLAASLTLAVLEFLSAQYIQGVFDLFAVLIGFMAVRKSEGVSYQQVMCFTMFSVIRLIIAIIYGAVSFADSNFDMKPTAPVWQFYIAIVVYCAAPIIFSVAIALSVTLFKELKKVINEMVSGEDGGADAGQGGGFGLFGAMGGSRAAAPQDAEAGNSGSYQAPLLSSGARSEPPPTLSGFRAFHGQGRRLDS